VRQEGSLAHDPSELLGDELVQAVAAELAAVSGAAHEPGKERSRRLKERSAERKATRPERVQKRAAAKARRIEHKHKYSGPGDPEGGIG